MQIAKGRESEISSVLRLLLTPKEQALVIRRLLGVTMLKEGRTYFEVSDKLGLSPNTVRALRNGIEKGEYVRWGEAKRVYKKKKTVRVSDFDKKELERSMLMNFLLSEVDRRARAKFFFD